MNPSFPHNKKQQEGLLVERETKINSDDGGGVGGAADAGAAAQEEERDSKEQTMTMTKSNLSKIHIANRMLNLGERQSLLVCATHGDNPGWMS